MNKTITLIESRNPRHHLHLPSYPAMAVLIHQQLQHSLSVYGHDDGNHINKASNTLINPNLKHTNKAIKQWETVIST